MSSTLPNLEEKGQFLKQLREWARQAITNAQQMVLQQQNRTNRQGMFQGFSTGDRVWLDGTNLKLSHPSKKLAAKQYGPFTITKVISPVIYCLALPLSWKIFDTFHATLLFWTHLVLIPPPCPIFPHPHTFLPPPSRLLGSFSPPSLLVKSSSMLMLVSWTG